MEEKTIDVIFYVLSYKISKEVVEDLIIKDNILKEIAEQYSKTLGDTEIFKIDYNLIYTEYGYIILLYKELVDL